MGDKSDHRTANAHLTVGTGQAATSRSKGRGVLGLTQKDKLKLGRAAAANLIEGTKRRNRAKAKKAKKQKASREPYLPT